MTSKPRSKIQVKFRLPVATHKALTAVAAHRGTSITEEINRALREFLASKEAGNAVAQPDR